MFSLGQKSAEYGTTDRRWLYGLHGTDNTLSATLDGSLFPASKFPDGVVPSGTVIAQVTATRLWGPYDNAATDGRGTARGLLFSDRQVAPGARTDASVFHHGQVFRDLFPENAGLDSAAEADLPGITFVNGKGA